MPLFAHARPPSGVPVRYHPSSPALVNDASLGRFLAVGVAGARVDVVFDRLFRLGVAPMHETGLGGGKRNFRHQFVIKTGRGNGNHSYRNLLLVGGREGRRRKGKNCGSGGPYLWLIWKVPLAPPEAEIFQNCKGILVRMNQGTTFFFPPFFVSSRLLS